MSSPVVRADFATSSTSDAVSPSDRRDAILLTTDFFPRVGGIADYLGGLWREAGAWGIASVHSTVPGGEKLHALARTLPQPPDRKLGARWGDRIPPMRRVNTLAHFAALRRYARRTLSPLLKQSDGRSRVCIGIWNPLAHFWCETLAAARQPYALFAYGLDVIEPLYGTVAPWRVTDFRRAARVIACSAGTAAIAAERLGVDRARTRVVHPGIDTGGYVAPNRDEVAALRSTLGLIGDRIILSVGRLVPRKGFDRALRAFAEYRGTHRRGEYLIAGDGPERSALEALANELGVREQVRFLGAVDERTKITLYELCDVFAMPNSLMKNTDWEGFGIVFLEAARAGKPSLGGANGGVPDAIIDGVTGLLVDSSDPRRVTEGLARLLSDDALRARLGAAARARAAAKFDWPVIGAQFRSVLEEAW
jgi:phosphatidylinositol alpha-1,6-mannosyltransferase